MVAVEFPPKKSSGGRLGAGWENLRRIFSRSETPSQVREDAAGNGAGFGAADAVAVEFVALGLNEVLAGDGELEVARGVPAETHVEVRVGVDVVLEPSISPRRRLSTKRAVMSSSRLPGRSHEERSEAMLEA